MQPHSALSETCVTCRLSALRVCCRAGRRSGMANCNTGLKRSRGVPLFRSLYRPLNPPLIMQSFIEFFHFWVMGAKPTSVADALGRDLALELGKREQDIKRQPP